MTLIELSKQDKNVVVKLSADELVKIMNCMYHADSEDKNDTYYELHAEIMLAANLCQYGRVDKFCFEQMKKSYEECWYENKE